MIQNLEKNEKYRPEQKCDHSQIIRIVWEGLYKRKTLGNQMTKNLLKNSVK